jgi:hypothetical protein
VTLYHDRVNWDTSDVRIYASNRLRPWAIQGGIAGVRTTDPATSTIVYEPGMVHMAAVWNRYGDPGELGEDWPRTLAHELAHYALFLDDDCLGLDAGGFLIPVTTCPSAMRDPYRGDWSELHPETGWSQECGTTLAARTSGRPDWRTVSTFYPWLPNVLTNTNSGPVNLPLNVTQLRVVAPVTATQALEDPRFYLQDVNGTRVQPGLGARAFLYGRDLAGQERLIDLGRPAQDTALARGAQPGARLCVFEPGQWLGCRTIVPGDNQQFVLRPPGTWQPEVIVTPVATRTITLRVKALPAGLALRARLYSLEGSASSVITLTAAGADYTGTFNLARVRRGRAGMGERPDDARVQPRLLDHRDAGRRLAHPRAVICEAGWAGAGPGGFDLEPTGDVLRRGAGRQRLHADGGDGRDRADQWQRVRPGANAVGRRPGGVQRQGAGGRSGRAGLRCAGAHGDVRGGHADHGDHNVVEQRSRVVSAADPEPGSRRRDTRQRARYVRPRACANAIIDV